MRVGTPLRGRIPQDLRKFTLVEVAFGHDMTAPDAPLNLHFGNAGLSAQESPWRSRGEWSKAIVTSGPHVSPCGLQRSRTLCADIWAHW